MNPEIDTIKSNELSFLSGEYVRNQIRKRNKKLTFMMLANSGFCIIEGSMDVCARFFDENLQILHL